MDVNKTPDLTIPADVIESNYNCMIDYFLFHKASQNASYTISVSVFGA